MDTIKNVYGLSEGVFKACLFLGLKFPPEVSGDPQQEHVPSDYFGEDVELDSAVMDKLSTTRLFNENFDRVYEIFKTKYLSQKPFKHNKTDLNVYFCDFILFSERQTGASYSDYFDFEFYRKSAATQSEFITQEFRNNFLKNSCDVFSCLLPISNKPMINKVFVDFLHRDWLDACHCSLEDFEFFVKKHPRFFSKPFNGSLGKGAAIIDTKPDDNLEELLADIKSKKCIVEEVVVQHESIHEFCPDTVNTIRVNTFLDAHNVVHILTTGGRFGRMGNVVDNFHGGGLSVMIDPKTGVVTSDAINRVHERFSKHPDTGKTFMGFQYPAWENLRKAVTKMARLVPQIPHLGWDLAINDKGETVIIEVNNNPDVDVQQAPDSVGRLHLYKDIVLERKNYSDMLVRILGYRVNELHNFNSSYDPQVSRDKTRLQAAMNKLVPDCASLMDLGCRKEKRIKAFCPEGVKYIPVDFRKHDDEVIACNFNDDEFPNIEVDTCISAFTAEYVEHLPQFLANMCAAAQKQILMWCRPFDRELSPVYRWRHYFSTDFTEKFLIETMNRYYFKLVSSSFDSVNNSLYLYDFRRIR